MLSAHMGGLWILGLAWDDLLSTERPPNVVALLASWHLLLTRRPLDHVKRSGFPDDLGVGNLSLLVRCKHLMAWSAETARLIRLLLINSAVIPALTISWCLKLLVIPIIIGCMVIIVITHIRCLTSRICRHILGRQVSLVGTRCSRYTWRRPCSIIAVRWLAMAHWLINGLVACRLVPIPLTIRVQDIWVVH